MKASVYLFTLILGILSYSFAQNKREAIKEDTARDLALTSFMKAQVSNDVTVLRRLISNDAIILIPAKTDQKRLTKAEYIAFIKESGRVDQACRPSLEIITATPTTVTARVDYEYSGFMVQNLVKAEKRTGNWLITELNKFFAPKPQQEADPLIVMQ